MDVFNHDLETVEAACFSDLDFGGEVLNEVFADDCVRTGKKSEYECEKAPFVGCKAVVPVNEVVCKVDFVYSPERSLGSFVHVPDLKRRGLADMTGSIA